MLRRCLGLATVTACAWAAAACGGSSDRGKSEIHSPGPGEAGAQPEPPSFPSSVGTEKSCCTQYCQALVDAGCTDLGTTTDECVANACPVPSGVPDSQRDGCLAALGEALCCAWRVSGSECTGTADPHGLTDCSGLASDADTACTPP